MEIRVTKEITKEHDSMVMKVFPPENLNREMHFPENNIADLQTVYQGPSPYHLDYCGYEHCKSGYSFGPYIRSSYLLHIVIHGKGTYCVDGKTYSISKGQLFLISPGITTTYQADIEEPWGYYWIGFSGYQATYILKQMGFTEAMPVISMNDLSPLIECIERMFLSDKITFANELQRTAELLTFFTHVINSRPQNQLTARHSKSEYAEMAMRYISNNFSRKIQISELADHIGVDRSYLSKSFHTEYQMSPQEYLVRLRMQQAATLLENPDHPISYIAMKCGYPDALAFTKIFRQRMGCSPSQYRLNMNSVESPSAP